MTAHSCGRRPGDAAALRRQILALGAALMVGLLASPAIGQSQPETIGTNSSITLEVRKGQVVRMPDAAATVFVGDPEVADVQAQSPTIVYLFGRRAGSTSLYAVGENDELLLRSTVFVQHNLSGLRQSIEQLMPGSEVTATTIDGSIVLDGTVDSPVQAQELRELASRYLGDEETLLFRVNVSSPT
jgi:pilus assembly protein CpaC